MEVCRWRVSGFRFRVESCGVVWGLGFTSAPVQVLHPPLPQFPNQCTCSGFGLRGQKCETSMTIVKCVTFVLKQLGISAHLTMNLEVGLAGAVCRRLLGHLTKGQHGQERGKNAKRRERTRGRVLRTCQRT